MNKLSFRSRINLGFSLIFIIMLFTTLFSIWQLQVVQQNLVLVYEHPFKVSNSIREIQIEVYNTERMIATIGKIETQNQFDSLAVEMNVSDSLLDDDLKLIHKQYLGNKLDIDSLINHYIEWELMKDKIYRLREEKNNDSLEWIINSENHKQAIEIIYHTKTISDFALNKAVTIIDQTIVNTKRSFIVLLGTLLFASMLVIIISHLISKSINRPIKRFIDGAITIFSIQSEKTDFKSHREEELFNYTLTELRHSYQNIEQQNEEIRSNNEQLSNFNLSLEEKVKDRTRELKESEEKYRLLSENTIDGVSLIEQNKFKYVSEGFLNMCGYEKHEIEDFLFDDIYKFIHHDDAKQIKEIIEKAHLQQTKNFQYSYRLKNKNGQFLWVEDNINAEYDSFGKHIRSVIHTRNIAERKQAEEIQNQTSTRLALAMRVGGVGIWEYDIVDNILLWDDQMFSLYGVDKQNFGGAYEAWQASVHPDDLEKSNEEIQMAIRGEKEFDTEFRVLWPDGSIHNIRAISIVHRNKSGQALSMVGTNWDITEQKKSVLTIQQQNQELQRLNIDKDRFISILAHDLKSPFNTIMGYSELLSKNLHKYDIAKIENQVNIIRQTTNHTYNLLEDILLWARAQSGKLPFEPKKVNFTNIYQDVADNMKLISDSKNITINYLCKLEINIFVDINMIKTILRNLISNAIKFTNTDGSININAEQNKTEVIITVSDNGVGIAPEIQKKLFDASQMYTSKGTAEETGTGLGLMLCKEFVKKHGGKIWVESELGKGSTFYFSIPNRLILIRNTN